MSGNLASTCHQPMTFFATALKSTGKTHINLEIYLGKGNKLELAQSLLN
jgi:hypothetical protein